MNLIEIQKNLISGFFLKLYILYVLINLNYVLMNVFKRKFYTNTNYNKRIEWILKCPRGFFFSCMILHSVQSTTVVVSIFKCLVGIVPCGHVGPQTRKIKWRPWVTAAQNQTITIRDLVIAVGRKQYL